MTSKPLPKIKTRTKLGNIFKSREAPTNSQSETKIMSEPEPVSKPPAAASVAESPTLATNTPEAAAVKLEASNLNQPKTTAISLWNRAYDNLRENDKKLVEFYERLLSGELQTTTTPKNVQSDLPAAGYGNDDGSYVQAENQINGNDHSIRRTQLQTIASNGLQQLEGKKAKYTIFGHEFILRDQLGQATQFIQTVKYAIDVAVRASPEASVAWAGICVILPIFMNPSVAEEASRDGYLYVTSRMQFYVKLESLLSASNKQQETGLDTELEQRLIALYQLIIGFQIRIVRRVYITRLKRLKEDTVEHENWKGMIAEIQESEKKLSNDLKLVKVAAIGNTLDELNRDAEKLFTDINSMLGSMFENNRSASTFYFQNQGPGDQFNATGGTQNNVTGNGRQFSGMTFSAPVTFN